MKVRTTHEIDEEQARTLYVRLPHTIRNIDEIRDLFFGDIRIKLPRKSGRYCHVIFSNVDEKIKNLKAARKKLIDNKPIIACNPKPKLLTQKKNDEKKKKMKRVQPVITAKPEVEEKITQICFVKNIPGDATLKEVKALFPNAKNVAFPFRGKITESPKIAIVKFKDIKIAGEYLKKQRPWPTLKGKKLEISHDMRKQKKNKKSLKSENDDSKEKKNIKVKTEKNDDEIKIKSESEECDDDEDDDDDDDEEDEDEDNIKTESVTEEE